MESIRLFLVIVLVTGTIWEETSALIESMRFSQRYHENRKAEKKPKRPIKPVIIQEAEADFADANSEVKFNLAPSYGSLNSQTLKELDETLKVMMGGIIEMDMPESVTWKEAQNALDSNSFMIRQENLSVSRLKKISFDSIRFLGFTTNNRQRNPGECGVTHHRHYIHYAMCSPGNVVYILNKDEDNNLNNLNNTRRYTREISKITKIGTWFNQLIRNVDIIRNTDIDLLNLANMISKHTIDILKNAFTEKIKKKTLVDLGILRFPDISQPFFTLYRINLMAKCLYNTYLLHQNEKSYLVGFFQKEVYYPNEDYINKMSNDLIGHLLMEVEDLFSD